MASKNKSCTWVRFGNHITSVSLVGFVSLNLNPVVRKAKRVDKNVKKCNFPTMSVAPKLTLICYSMFKMAHKHDVFF